MRKCHEGFKEAESYSEPCQLKPLTIFAKNFILDVWQGFEYASGEVFTTF